MRQQQDVAASTRTLGDQFEYRIPSTVTIPRDSSALLPIVHSEINADKVSVFTDGGGPPRIAVWLENTSGLTLDGGSITVLDENAFAGEGLVDTLKPGEHRLVSYAVDLGVEVSVSHEKPVQSVERVHIADGLMWFHRRLEESRLYLVRNEDDRQRRLIVQHPVRPEWKLDGSTTPIESSSSYHRFDLNVLPKATATLFVKEYSPEKDGVELRTINSHHVEVWLKDRTISKEVAEALAPLALKQKEIQDCTRRMSVLESDRENIFNDQESSAKEPRRFG